MPGQHPNAVKEDRSRRAIAVAEEMKAAWEEAQVGREQEVLFEETQGQFAVGHAPNYAKVYVKTAEDLHNQAKQVRITGRYQDGLIGERI
jgi:threonylcarbamoyladenosine tRNA methylthiotransferase MtaB